MISPISNGSIARDLAPIHPGTDGARRPQVPDRLSSGAVCPAPAPAPASAPQPISAANGSPGAPAADAKEVDGMVLCRLLSLLADKTRLRILWLLADGERAVGSMTTELGLPQPTVSHHLAWLRTMHLVSPRRAGKNVFYALGRAARTEEDGSLSLLTADTVVSIGRRAHG